MDNQDTVVTKDTVILSPFAATVAIAFFAIGWAAVGFGLAVLKDKYIKKKTVPPTEKPANSENSPII